MIRPLVRRFPLVSFFAVAYGVSALALAVIGLPTLVDTPRRFALTSLLMFPVMVITVAAAGLGLSAAAGGRASVTTLLQRATRWRVSPAFYASLLLPPAGILAVLLLLWFIASPVYAPNFFPIGFAFGVIAGFFEEFGWSGFAFPRLRSRLGELKGALALGLLWGLWHLPVVDSLGAATPHGRAWPFFFVAFVLMVTALRLLIAWVYYNTGSLLLAQLMHASSTGSLVVFGAKLVTPAQEAIWYALYALFLGVVAFAIMRFSRGHVRQFARPAGMLFGKLPD